MWKVYLRQIVRLLRENKFFSVVYILGTALSVAMIMLILITYHIKSGDIGVEDPSQSHGLCHPRLCRAGG